MNDYLNFVQTDCFLSLNGVWLCALSHGGSRGVRGFRHHVVIAVRHRQRLGEPAPNVTGARPAIIRTVRPIISVSNLTKTYASGLQALRRIDLQIRKAKSSPCSGRTEPARRR